MKSLIEQLLPFEIYLRALSWALIVVSLIQRWWNALIKRKKQTSKDKNSLLVWEDDQSNTIQQEDLYEESLKNNHYWETKEQNENLSDYPSNHQSIEEEITHKLLKQVVWESDDYKEIIEKKEDINEDDSSSKNDSDNTVWEQSQSKASPLSPEIYNINTNHESINKQKIAYEIVKHEIDTLKTRNLRVEYEKKLIEATMNFPEENEFHISLGDRYIERWEFKKAQSLFKKLHLLDENDHRNTVTFQYPEYRWRKLVVNIMEVDDIGLKFPKQWFEFLIGLAIPDDTHRHTQLLGDGESGCGIINRLHEKPLPRGRSVFRILHGKKSHFMPMNRKDTSHIKKGALSTAFEKVVFVYEENFHWLSLWLMTF